MKTALIGYTGFVGSNLLDAQPFDDLYNTSNIADIAGREYDLVVSAGNRADSHRINQRGQEDLGEIDNLVDTVLKADVGKLVLISTVCVYPEGGAPDEDTPLSPDGLTPYGSNRLHQERRFSDQVDTLIMRLPQLYGARLKKGVVYDLANDYRVEHIRPNSEFQHYDVRLLWTHIEWALANEHHSFNLATPPITNEQLAREVFGRDISTQTPPGPESPFARMYTRNMTTKYAADHGGPDGYLLDHDQEIASLRAFTTQTLQERS